MLTHKESRLITQALTLSKIFLNNMAEVQKIIR